MINIPNKPVCGYADYGRYHKGLITYWTMPTLDSLRSRLGVPVINTGRQYSLNGPSGIITDDLEGLHAISDELGRITLRSGTEFPMVVYRGQTEVHKTCAPSLARMHYAEDQLLALCRNVAFEDAIGDHPYVQLCEQARFMDAPLNIDKQGLAQHYGLATDLLDVTSNFEIASFFATCRWDATARNYQPVKFSSQFGVLYRLSPFIFIGPNEVAEFKHVGWQPFKRPEEQRASTMLLKKGQDFVQLPSVQMIRFRQSARVSVRIWKSFDEGRALFPNDAVSELAERAMSIVEFTRSQIDKAWVKLEAWNGTESAAADRLLIERIAALSIVVAPVLSWHDLDVERDADKLQDQLRAVLDVVRFRLACYG